MLFTYENIASNTFSQHIRLYMLLIYSMLRLYLNIIVGLTQDPPIASMLSPFNLSSCDCSGLFKLVPLLADRHLATQATQHTGWALLTVTFVIVKGNLMHISPISCTNLSFMTVVVNCWHLLGPFASQGKSVERSLIQDGRNKGPRKEWTDHDVYTETLQFYVAIL